MANVQVKNSIDNPNAANRAKFDQLGVSFGKVLAADWTDGDTLVFDQISAKTIVFAKFVSSAGAELEVYSSTDLSAALEWDTDNAGTETDISYVIHYVQGTGHIGDGSSQAGEGKLLQLTITA